jgi:hypothetical protein
MYHCARGTHNDGGPGGDCSGFGKVLSHGDGFVGPRTVNDDEGPRPKARAGIDASSTENAMATSDEVAKRSRPQGLSCETGTSGHREMEAPKIRNRTPIQIQDTSGLIWI